jgi:hypothetical protein
MMKRLKLHWLAAAVCLGAAPAISADFDGSKPLICSSIEAHDCELGITCQRAIAEDLNVPQFIRVDFNAKTLSARGRTTKMQSHARSDGMLIVQGFENSRAFSITISEQTGKLVGAIAADEEGFMIFGACTPL